MQTEKKAISNATRIPMLQAFHHEIQHLQKTVGVNPRDPIYGRFAPEAMWNMDQVPFSFVRCHRRSYNLKGSYCWIKNQGPSGIDKRMCTIVLTLRAAGEQIVKPFVLFRGQGSLSKKLIQELDEWGIPYGFNEKAWSDGRTSCAYLRYFKGLVTQHAPEIKEHLLLLDNFSAQTTEDFVTLACDLDIIPAYFPPNCTHLVQPVDHHIAAWLKYMFGEFYKVEQELRNDEWTRYRTTKTLSVQARRYTMLQWMSSAWNRLKAMPEFIFKSFVSTGCLLKLDGTHEIVFKDIPNYAF
jgi:hypothetical protein